MHVKYSSQAKRGYAAIYYLCRSAAQAQDVTKQHCRIMGGLTVEEAVAQAFLTTLSPTSLDAMRHATERLAAKRRLAQQQVELELERARYEAQRCQRQYHAVEPENRLVARTLESQWNQALERVAELERAVRDAQAVPGGLSEAERSALHQLAVDLPQVWEHPAAPFELKKRLLRTVIQEVVAYVEPQTIRVLIHWRGGQHTELHVQKRRPGQHRWTTDKATTELVRELARLMSDKDIAGQLNRMGIRSAKGHSWTRLRVGNFRNLHAIAKYQPGERQARGDLSIEDAAACLGVSYMTVLRMIQRQDLPANQVCPGAPWIIRKEALHAVSRRGAAAKEAEEVPLPLFTK
jgi:excisionase family DNA binding protein